MGLHTDFLLIRTLYLVPFARYSASKILVCDLDLSGSLKVKYFNFSRKPVWDFIMMFCWYELSISYRLRDLPHLRFRLVTLTFQSHQRSNISHFLRSQCATLSRSLWYEFSCTVCEIFRIYYFGYWPRPSRVTKVQIFHIFWEANVQLCNGLLLIRTLYLVPFARYFASNISASQIDFSGSPKVKYSTCFGELIWVFILTFCWYNISISCCLRDIPHLRFRLVILTFQGHRRSNVSPFTGSRYGTL